MGIQCDAWTVIPALKPGLHLFSTT